MRNVGNDEDLSAKLAAMIDPEIGPTTAQTLARIANLSVQSIYNARDGKGQRAETRDAIRRAVDHVESSGHVPRPSREGANSARIPIGRGVYLMVEDGADPAALARILRVFEQENANRA